MMSEEVSVPSSPSDRWKAWDDFLETTPHTGFMQSSWWADFRAAYEYQHFAAILKAQGAIVGGAVVLKHSYAPESCFYYIPEGPVLPDDESSAGEIFEAVLETIESRRKTETQTVSHLRIEPRLDRMPGFLSGFRTIAPFADRYMEQRLSLCIDLRSSEPAILAQMKPKGRYNIGVAQRLGVRVVEDNSAQGLRDFLGIYGETVCRKAIKSKPAKYFKRLLSILTSVQKGSLFFAEYQGLRLAAAMVVYFGPRASYLFGGSVALHRRVMAPYLLHFEIMRKAKSMGHEWYDLWGVAPENEPDHRLAKISIFKRKFGGQEIRLAPTLDYVYDTAAYDNYVATVSNPAKH
jgi:lipid II:glycine glycyltransferase (peptidoglycan interpeptide bridge formation enzyme)